jgi:hypothetical protein
MIEKGLGGERPCTVEVGECHMFNISAHEAKNLESRDVCMRYNCKYDIVWENR